jgi:hypothetical protein
LVGRTQNVRQQRTVDDAAQQAALHCLALGRVEQPG